MIIGHKYKIYPDEYQSEVLKLWIGHQRFIYNAKVQEQDYWFKFYKQSLSITGFNYSPDQSYSQFRNQELTPWLDLVPPEVLRNGCYRYMSGYQRFKKNLSQVPATKSKYGKQSVLLTSELFTFHPDNSNDNKNHKIYIGNNKFLVGNLKFIVNKNNKLVKKDKNIKSNVYIYEYNIPKSITISLNPSGQWFISFNSEEINNKAENIILRTEEELMYEYSIKSNKESFVLGIDRGTTLPAAASNGKTYKLDEINAKRIAKKEDKIKRYQLKLSRQKKNNKFSNNQNKTKKKIGKLRNYINNTRNDFCHKLSHELVNDEKNQVFVFENLKLANMVKKPKPKLANNLNNNNNNSTNLASTNIKPKYLPNKAAAKAGLNRELHNAELGRIKNYVGYKAARVNKLSLFVNPAYSSQECSVCHHVDSNNRLSQSEFKCVKCNHTENADLNASKVIKYRGLVVLNNFDITMYKPKSKKTVKFRNKSKSNKEVKVGQGLSEFKPAESSSDIFNSNELSVLNSMTQETITTSHRL